MIYTPRQAAEILGVDVSLVRKYLNAGVIPGAYKARGTRWVIPHEGLMAMQNGEVKTNGVFRKRD